MLPAFRDKEAARLRDPEIEDKETRPPPRYKEGTLIEAMQNAWRFVEDEVLRGRLKEAKGIGTPATRAKIIAGLKKQGFLTAQGQNIVPTDRGLALFGVLERADPALVDPGVTAELECLLDDVVTGRQEMMGAIDLRPVFFGLPISSQYRRRFPKSRCARYWIWSIVSKSWTLLRPVNSLI